MLNLGKGYCLLDVRISKAGTDMEFVMGRFGFILDWLMGFVANAFVVPLVLGINKDVNLE